MRLVTVGLVLALGAVAQTPALTAKRVVAKSLAARGGAAKFAAVRSLRFTGHLQLENGPAAIQVWTASKPYRVRIELQLPQGRFVQGYDGTTAWEIDPGKTQARVLAGREAMQVEDQALAFVDLMADPVDKLELLGTETVDGRPCYVLRFTFPTGDQFTQYVDAKTWLVNHEDYPGGFETISDYRKVDGLLLPFRYVSGPKGQPGAPLVRERIVLNEKLDPTLFRAPR